MIKKGLLFFVVCLAPMVNFAQRPVITHAVGWLESVYVTWEPMDSIQTYHVYYSGEGITDKRIDDQLIRSYKTCERADIPGLRAGKYTVRVVPVISGKEGEGTTTDSLIVKAYDRTGYAFWKGRTPGAYQADGTPKDRAVVLYITGKTKNTISLDVSGASENPCVGLQTILDGFKKGKDTRPLIVRLVGQITDLSYMLNGDVVVENANNPSGYITVEGVGNDAVADGWGLRIKNASNVEVRNIGFMNCNSSEGDDVGLQQGNDHVWVHQCDFFYGEPGSDADQVKGDGALDCKKSTYVTFSYNHFWDTGKSNLLGLSEGTTAGLFITYHHNWYDHSDSRHPRVRYYSAHVYNNYYDGNAKYGAGSTLGSSVFVEANYFRHCKYPMMTSMQGTDVFNESTQSNDYVNMPTFSKEDGGTIKAFNNVMTGQKRFVPYGNTGYPNSTVDFDAYVATSRNEKVDNAVVSYQGKHTYNNFDTNDSLMYTYTPDSPDVAKENVTKYAGRVEGGDVKWTFDNAIDDEADAVNAGLKAALTGYQTSLVLVQGDSLGTGGTTPVDPGQGGDSTNVYLHNFTLSGKTSAFFSITGNLSDSKGTVTYVGLTLTQCLKIEAATVISFTTTKQATLILVFNTGFSGKISIDGTSYNAVSGVLTLTISAGSHKITKTDSANLYYISLSNEMTGLSTQCVPGLAVFPNPVTDKLTIVSDADIDRVEIFNLAGVRMKRAASGIRSLDLSDLKQGPYLMTVITAQGVFRQTILKK